MPFEPERLTLTECGSDAPYDWLMLEALRYRESPSSEWLTVTHLPFQTDLASVPQLLTWYIPRYGLYTKAAVLHDFLCQFWALDRRFEADRIFRAAMKESDVPFARRWLMWGAVTWMTMVLRLARMLLLSIVLLLVSVTIAVVLAPRLGLTDASVLAVLMTLLTFAVLSAWPSHHRELWSVLGCYLITVPGILLVAASLPLLLVRGFATLVELAVEPAPFARAWAFRVMPIARVLRAILIDQLRAVVGRAAAGQSEVLVKFQIGTARERRLRQLLVSSSRASAGE